MQHASKLGAALRLSVAAAAVAAAFGLNVTPVGVHWSSAQAQDGQVMMLSYFATF